MKILFSLLWLFAAWLILWNVLRIWPGERLWAVALVNYFTPWFALALVPLILLTMIFGKRALSATLLAAFLLIGLRYIFLFTPKPASAASVFPLKVMTFNVHQRNTDIDALVDVILSENADIVALQEMTPFVSESLAQSLESRYPYHTLDKFPEMWGQGLLSRFPLEQISELPDYQILSAYVQTPGGKIKLINIHSPTLFPFSWKEDWQIQKAFIDDLIADIDNVEGPLVVLGDFNTTPRSEHYASVTRYLNDTFLESGWGFGFSYPAIPKFGIRLPTPIVRIDYVFISDHFTSNDTRVLTESGSSDHRPVVSLLTIIGDWSANSSVKRLP